MIDVPMFARDSETGPLVSTGVSGKSCELERQKQRPGTLGLTDCPAGWWVLQVTVLYGSPTTTLHH